jgi:hypothetical protein
MCIEINALAKIIKIKMRMHTKNYYILKLLLLCDHTALSKKYPTLGQEKKVVYLGELNS